MKCQVNLLAPIVPLVPIDERNPTVLKPNRSENSLSPLNEMQFTNGVPMECQVTLLVAIVPLVPMDERNPTLLKPNRSENSLSPINETQFNNGVPMQCQVTLLVPIVPLVPMDGQNPAVLKPNRIHQWGTSGMPSHSICTNRTIGTNGRTESSCTQTEP